MDLAYSTDLLQALVEGYQIVEQYLEIRSCFGQLADAIHNCGSHRQFQANTVLYNSKANGLWSEHYFNNNPYVKHNYQNVFALSVKFEIYLEYLKAEAIASGIDWDNCVKPEVLERIEQEKDISFQLHLKETGVHERLEEVKVLENKLKEAKQMGVVTSQQALLVARDPAVWSNVEQIHEEALKNIHAAVELSNMAKDQIKMYESHIREQHSIINKASTELWGRRPWW